MTDFVPLGWLAIGLIVGIGSKLVMPGPRSGGWIATLLTSTTGAVLDGWSGSHLFGIDRASQASSWIASAIGAVIMLAIYRFVLRLDTTR